MQYTGDMNDTDDMFPGDAAEFEPATEVEVMCPYCGELVVIALDLSGGATQEYVEDCQVCCRPWQVHVTYGIGGMTVRVEQAG